MDIDAQTVGDIIGHQHAIGPAGRGIQSVNTGGVNIETGTAVVETKLDQKSLASARANSGVDSLLPPEPKIGKAASFVASKNDKADALYSGMFAKLGVHPALVSKGPIARRQRHSHNLIRTFNKMAAQRTSPRQLNAEQLPASLKERMVDAAIKKGASMTPLGPVQQAVKAIRPLRDQYARWQHALIGGSYPQMVPRPS